MTRAGEWPAWQPLSRDAFRQLRRGGRVWTVHAEPHHVDGLVDVVIRASDLVRRVSESLADDYW